MLAIEMLATSLQEKGRASGKKWWICGKQQRREIAEDQKCTSREQQQNITMERNRKASIPLNTITK